MRKMENKEIYPHSPDVEERLTSDGGFSAGWGLHFPTCEDYWFEAHVHYGDEDGGKSSIQNSLESHAEILNEFNVKKSLIIFKTYDKETGWSPDEDNNLNFFSIDQIQENAKFFKEQKRFFWSPWIRYNDPNLSLLDKCIEAGASCIKLHNANIIVDGEDPNCWYLEKWHEMFKRIDKSGLPILWHVTQRLTACPYRGMGANSYWKEGIPKGVKYTNQDLLDIFIDIVEKYPNINFIGAHQLHIGYDRLGELFDKYLNLYIDTSIGCFLRLNDDFYSKDKEYLREFFIKYYNRFLFATDVYYKTPHMEDWKFKNEYLGHMRFINKLNLPNHVLQAISHENAEKLYKTNKP